MASRVITLSGLLSVILAGSAMPSMACVANVPPQFRVDREFGAIVLTTVVEAGYQPLTREGVRPWSGTVEVRRVISGETPARTLPIGRSGDPVTCDDGIGPPWAGELWVLYLTQGQVLSYPYHLVRAFDRRLPPDEDKRAPTP
jgi:hypothetical protein